MKTPLNTLLVLPRVKLGLGIAMISLLSFLHLQATTITGRVSDATSGSYLPGALVTVEGTGKSAVASDQGSFTISGLEPGTYRIRVSYLGYGSITESVNVGASGVSNVDIELGTGREIEELEALVIDGSAESRSRALQQKMSANNILEVISADRAGSLPDRNVADALSRVSGISLDVDGGEGRFVSIRGVEPNLNNVTFNGSTMAPPSVAGRTGRAMPLDIIAASQISEIEVVKSVTPDMDAQSLGGSINIKTVSAFDREQRFIFGAAEFGENLMLNKDISQFDLTMGDVFGPNREFGVAIMASYSERPFANTTLESEWEIEDGAGMLQTIVRDDDQGRRARLGLNLNLEYRPAGEDGDTRIYFRGLYNDFDQISSFTGLNTIARSDPISVTPDATVFNRVRWNITKQRQIREQEIVNLSLGGSHKFDNLTIELDVTYSESTEDVPENNSIQFRSDVNTPAGVVFQTSRFLPTFEDHGQLAANLNDIAHRRFRLEDSLVEEETWSPSIDLQYDFDDFMGNGWSGFFRAGFKYTDRDRFVDDNSVRPVGDLTVGDMNAAGPGVPFFDNQFFNPVTISFDRSFAFLDANPDLFEIDPSESISNSIEDDFDVTEEILALYAMINLDITPRLNIMAGFRYEDTDVELGAFEFREGDGIEPVAIPRSGEFSYDNWHPNFQAKYKLTDLQQVRFAFTSTIGRPAYEDASPISSLEFEILDDPVNSNFPLDGELETGNPTLDPFEAINIDLSYEFFLRSGGVLSVGLFYKDIDNPIFEFSEIRRDVVFDDLSFETLDVTETRNADSGEIKGIELNAQIPFSTFLPAESFLAAFGVDVNATFMDSEVNVFDREDENLPLFRQPDEVYNAALYYQRGGLDIRIAYNHKSESLWEISGNADEDIWSGDRHFYDLQASYRINPNFQIMANWKNITNETLERTFGQRDLNYTSTIFGSEIRVGTRFNF